MDWGEAAAVPCLAQGHLSEVSEELYPLIRGHGFLGDSRYLKVTLKIMSLYQK